MNKKFGSELGIGLIETLVAGAVGTIAIAGVTVGITSTSRAGRKVESSVDLVGIKAQLVSSIDCAKTMAGRTPGNACPAATYIALKNALNATVVGAGGQKFGDWTVVAQCTSSGIDVRAAKLTGGAANFSNTTAANFKTDEVNRNLPYSFDVSATTGHPKSQLFRPDPANPAASLCGAWFGGAAATDNIVKCGPQEVMRGVNLTQGTPICEAIPTCGGEQALKWIGNAFTCVESHTAGYINNNIVWPAINYNNANYINTQMNNATQNAINYVWNNYASTLGHSNNYARVIGSSDGDCASLARMKCPDGYYSFAYEARMPSSGNNCSLQCRKF